MAQMGSGALPNTLSARGQQVVGQAAISKVYWFNPSSSGDQFILQNNEGKLIVRGRCENANQSQWFDFSDAPISVDGYALSQLDSGQIDVYTV